jgi:hypothetical protein
MAGAALGGTDQLFVDNIFKDATQLATDIWLKAGRECVPEASELEAGLQVTASVRYPFLLFLWLPILLHSTPFLDFRIYSCFT